MQLLILHLSATPLHAVGMGMDAIEEEADVGVLVVGVGVEGVVEALVSLVVEEEEEGDDGDETD